jgi:oligoendopeptidase F
LTPDIQAIGKEKIGAFLQKDKGLEEYRQVLKDILRTAPHTLSPPEEAILSRVGMIAGAPYDIYSAYTSADMEFPMVKLSDGKEYRMTQAAYTKYRASNSRDDRKVVFDEFWKAYMKDQNTFGVLLNAQVQRDWFYGKTRKYDSSMAAALDAGNIPVKVYTQLVDGINANLPALYRYLELRKKMLGLPELTYYDMYPSIIKDVDMPFTYQEASDLVVEALKPLGPEYINPLKQAFTNRWVDVYPTDGKRSGAYSNGAFYDGHPYVLLNFNGDYESVSTLAHELGHSMHSYFSNKNQAFPNSDYAIFVAEVASTFNEAMLNDYMVKKETDPYKKLFLLGSNLERARQTIFRQAMFAEFEMKIHDRVEKGETLTGADLTKLYLELLKKYYGADKGVTRIDDAYGIEWAYIPHFYYDFYVYQYSTGQIAATALSEKVLSGEKGAADRYLDFLKSGSSDYPIEVLKKAGVDLTTPEPMELAMKSFNRTMDEIETILKEIDTKTKQAKKS